MIASGNHLLTQVKDNQPSLRRKLELGSAGRKPSGSAKSATSGRNRWETRELTVFPAKAWFRGSPWDGLIQTVLRLERTVCKRDPKTGLCKQTDETVFWVSSASDQTPERWNEWIRGSLAHRERQSLRARRRFCRGRFPHPQEPRHRRPLALLRLQHDQDRGMPKRPQRPLARRPGYQRNPQDAPYSRELNSPGVGHPLFDIALEDLQNVSARFSCVDGLSDPLLIVTVEDEVTGTGTLIHTLIFGVTEKETKIEILRDWELLQALNALTPKSSLDEKTVREDAELVLKRLKQAFDGELSAHAPTLRRPVSWPEMLFLPSKRG